METALYVEQAREQTILFSDSLGWTGAQFLLMVLYAGYVVHYGKEMILEDQHLTPRENYQNNTNMSNPVEDIPKSYGENNFQNIVVNQEDMERLKTIEDVLYYIWRLILNQGNAKSIILRDLNTMDEWLEGSYHELEGWKALGELLDTIDYIRIAKTTDAETLNWWILDFIGKSDFLLDVSTRVLENVDSFQALVEFFG